MKKIFIILTLSLVLFTGNVKADSSCEARLSFTGKSDIKIEITSSLLNRTGYVYMATISSKTESKRTVAFCLDMGHRAIGNDTYVIDRTARVTGVMRRSYQFLNGTTDFSKSDNQMKYMIAQIAIWLEQNNAYSEGNLKTFGWIAYKQYYCSGNRACSLSIGEDLTFNIMQSQFEKLVNSYLATAPFTGNLYIYKSLNHPNNQRFLAGVPLNTCPPDVENPEEPENPDEGKTCSGVIKQYASPAVCSQSNQNNIGEFWEEYVVENGVCGDADPDGTPEATIGEYCKLYCKETVTQSYPGGISGPISLGTNIVWPTSAATEHTVWGNLYSLSYHGTKSCKLKITDEEEIRNDYQQAIDIVNRYRSTYESIRQSGSTCDSRYETELSNARNNLNAVIANAQTAQNQVDSIKGQISNLESQRATYEQQQNQANGSLVKCQSTARSNCNKVGEVGFQGCYNEYISKNCAQYQNDAASAQGAINGINNTLNTLNTQLATANSDLATANQNKANAQAEVTRYENHIKYCNQYVESYSMASKIIEELNTCATYKPAAKDLYHFTSDTSISYNDEQYGATYNLSLIGETIYDCEGCNPTQSYKFDANNGTLTYLNQVVRSIEDRDIILNATATYSLPDNIYRYVSKKTNEPLMSPIGDYIDVGYSFLPTSYNAKVGKLYNLQIIVNSLGENGKFTNLANENTYTCNYSVMNAPTDECVCPDGTEHAGEDLFPIIYDASKSNPMTCADAQLKYCGGSNTEDERYYCPSDQVIDITDCLKTSSLQQCVSSLCPNGSGDKFCPNDSSIKMTACLNSGNSYQFCEDNLCGIDDDYHCPKGTFNDGMDIKPCVFANINMGLEAALQYCKDTVCPGGKRIIYRTISLRNPFPGKTAGETYITNQFSIEDHFGRYPGANWNSVNLVRNQILYNRGVESNAVYQKEPLYSFILDTNTIKEIRKYNDAQEKTGGYADFTLDCNDNGVACISSFIRNPLYGLTGGVCSANSKSDFYSCSER